jgi:hypothetical protein
VTAALLRLLLRSFWFLGYTAIEAFFTLCGTNHLGLSEARSARRLGDLSLFFVLTTSSGLIARVLAGGDDQRRHRLARLLLLVIFSCRPPCWPSLTKLPVLLRPCISALLMAGGVAWALININSLPMVVDAALPRPPRHLYRAILFLFDAAPSPG